MRSILVSAILATLVAAAPMAMAAISTQGTIKAPDMTAMTVTLDSGTIYRLPQGFVDPGLKTGERVAVVWDLKGADRLIDKVTILK